METIIKEKFLLFEKPNLENCKDKHCIICLESFESESLESDNLNQVKLIQLPCKCSNSIYHIDCIQELFLSGDNKNFCAYCTRKYQLLTDEEMKNIEKTIYENSIRIRNKILCDRNINLAIIFTHTIFNTILNLITISLIDSGNVNEVFSGEFKKCFLSSGYIAKILLNIVLMTWSSGKLDNIDSFIISSYLSQALLFGITVGLQDSIEYSKYLIIRKIYLSLFVIVGIVFFNKFNNFFTKFIEN